MKQRQDGYYWVKLGAEDWIIAEWSSKTGKWYTCGVEPGDAGDDLLKIDERKIVNPHND